ncbi:MAG: ABC transporter permease [Deltaproteobacteria bacterium]|nr:ABC transporter permease [Candidatus Zymogenaceae bacterium]
MMKFITKVWVIGENTFKEAIRDRILYSIVFFAVLILIVSTVLDVVTIGQRTKIIKDVGLASISLFGALIAIFVGIGLVYKELDKRTIYTIVSKPVTRLQFLLGKYLGLVFTIFVEVAAMSLIFCLIVFSQNGGVDLLLIEAIVLTFLELMIVCAVAIFFSSFTTPILSGMFTLGVYIIGHLTYDLYEFSHNFSGTALEKILKILYYVFPNLDNFNIRSNAVHGLPVSGDFLLFSITYGLLYIILLFAISSFIFNRKDFK